MKRTYTFFLHDASGERYEPAMLDDNTEALRHARRRLESDPNLLAVRVCFGDTLLFSLVQSEPSPLGALESPALKPSDAEENTILVALESTHWTARLRGSLIAACLSLPQAINQAWQASDAAAARGAPLGVRVIFPRR